MTRLAHQDATSRKRTVGRLLAVPLVLLAVGLLLAATVSGPWWYTWRAWGLVFVGMAAGAALGWAVRRAPESDGRPDPAAAAPPRPVERAPSPSHDTTRRPDPERLALVETLIDLHRQLPSTSLRYRIESSFKTVGVCEFVPDGDVFDPSRHMAVNVEDTSDASRVGRVARTTRSGFEDAGTVVRAAEVVVYRGEASSEDRAMKGGTTS